MRRTVFVCVMLSLVTAVNVYRYDGPATSQDQISHVIEDSLVDGSVVALNTEESVDFLQFTSSKVGWLGSHSGELYRTTDSGNTWESIDLGVTGFLAQMQFVSDRVGWVIVDQYLREAKKTDGTFCKLLHTEDAGKTWTTQLDLKATEFVDLNVVNGDEVWVLGSKFSASRQIIVSTFVLLQGKKAGVEWIDRSDQLNKFSAGIDGRVLESPAALFALAPRSLILMTRNAIILRSSDEGEHWSRIANLNTLGLPANKLVAHTTFPFVLASMGSSHGTASLLVMPGNDGSFIKNQLGGIYLKDVLYIPAKGLLACGTMLVETNSPQFRREGVILFSTDLGRSWTTIHRATHIKSINSVELNDQTIWAGGSNGYLVTLAGTQLL